MKKLTFLLIFFLSFNLPIQLKACLDANGDIASLIIPHPMTIETCVGTMDYTYVRILDYTTYGADVGDFCACALNLPAIHGQAISVTIVYGGTNIPVPGWSFTPNPNAQFSGSPDWQGFSSAVSEPIPPFIPVDILFVVDPFCLPDPSPNADCCVENANTLDLLFESYSIVIGTAGATSSGIPDHHIAIEPIDRATVSVPDCTDGILNGDEEGVDCGGTECVSCFPDTSDVCLTLDLVHLHVEEDALFEDDVIIQGDLCVLGESLTPSDLALKTNIECLEHSLSKIEQINPVQYKYAQATYPDLHLPDGKQYGVIAQELEKVFPEFVSEHPLRKDVKGNSELYKAVNYNNMIPILIASIKELNLKLESKAQSMQQMEKQLKELQLQIDQLRN